MSARGCDFAFYLFVNSRTSNLHMAKSATTIDHQINLLKSRGLTVHDGEKAREILLDIGYYRLGFYLFPFEKTYPELRNRSHEYIKGASLEDAVNACAHGLVLYDICLTKRIKRGPAHQTPQKSGNLIGAMRVIKYITEQVSANRATELSTLVTSLYEKLCAASPNVRPLIPDFSTI